VTSGIDQNSMVPGISSGGEKTTQASQGKSEMLFVILYYRTTSLSGVGLWSRWQVGGGVFVSAASRLYPTGDSVYHARRGRIPEAKPCGENMR
jgi:hypothetical protein